MIRWADNEASGAQPDAAMAEQFKTIQATYDSFQSDLRMAADGGQPVAMYLLAKTVGKAFPSETEQAERCLLYQRAMDKGLLAGAVMYFHECDKSFKTFDTKNPDHLKLLTRIQALLERSDPYQNAYPLPAPFSLCFIDPAAIPTGKPIGALLGLSTARQLTYEQYQADAAYLLALMLENDKGEATYKNQAYLNQALTLGCSDSFSLKPIYEKKFSQNKP